MTGPLMRGAGTARKIIADFLASDLPPYITLARTQWALQSWQLPVPVRYDSYDPLTVSAYPMVGSLVTRTREWVRNDITSAAEEVYQATYSVVLFVWVKTAYDSVAQKYEEPEYDSALRQRDDLLALMRTCILAKPSLGEPGVSRVDENTLSEDYLDAIKSNDQNPRWMAGGTITFDMSLVEQNYQTPLGAANTFTIEEDLLDPVTE